MSQKETYYSIEGGFILEELEIIKSETGLSLDELLKLLESYEVK